MWKATLTDKDKRFIKRHKHLPVAEISKRINRQYNTVRRYMERSGIERTKAIYKSTEKLTDEQKNKLIGYLKEDRIKQEWIAKQFGVSQSNISYYNRKHVKAA